MLRKSPPLIFKLLNGFFDNSEYRDIIAADCPEDAFYGLLGAQRKLHDQPPDWVFKLSLDAFRIARETETRVYENNIQQPFCF